jgi:hypothetical protein
MTEAPRPVGFEFTGDDFEELIDAVSRMAVSDHLPKEQWGLLLAIFAAAAGSVVQVNKTKGRLPPVDVYGGVIKDTKDEEVVALRRQLREAHMPAAKPPGQSFGDMVSPQKPPPRGKPKP